MDGSNPVRRVPWKKLGVLLAMAAIAAWVLGFLIGTVVRLLYGF